MSLPRPRGGDRSPEGARTITSLHLHEAGYPERLRDLRRPPEPLWVAGDPAALERRPAVAIVGTRRITPYGERIARELAGAAAGAGAIVVSGLAQGVDSEAHRAVLEAGASSIAVLGEGLTAFDAGVRGRRRHLATRLRQHGALVSEYAPGLRAQGWMFARRNATIAALADVVVIVEAGERSGALITAAEAAQLGRPLYAIPGPLGAMRSEGTNSLIASGTARALTGAPMLLEALGLRSIEPAPQGAGTGVGAALRELLAAGPLSADALGAQLRLAPAEAATLLATALLRGEIVLTGDGRIARCA